MDRYDRQRMIKNWDQTVISEAHILVVGAGTTGNEVIKNLALLGFRYITIVDNDEVQEVNLSRSVLFRDEDIEKPKAEVAAKRAQELNPAIDVVSWNRDVIYGIGSLDYGKYQCVILTVDNLEARMWVNRYCWINKTPVIDTGVGGLNGNVFVAMPAAGPCIECTWNERDYQRLFEKYQCLRIGLALAEFKIPMVITSAAIIGGIAVQECVRMLHEKKARQSVRAGMFYWYSGDDRIFDSWQYSRKDDCPGHKPFVEERHVLTSRAKLTLPVTALKDAIMDELGADKVELLCDKEIVYSVVCKTCNKVQTISPTFLGQFRRFPCPACGTLDIVPNDYTAGIRDNYTLLELGLPTNHLLHVVFAKHENIDEADIATD